MHHPRPHEPLRNKRVLLYVLTTAIGDGDSDDTPNSNILDRTAHSSAYPEGEDSDEDSEATQQIITSYLLTQDISIGPRRNPKLAIKKGDSFETSMQWTGLWFRKKYR